MQGEARWSGLDGLRAPRGPGRAGLPFPIPQLGWGRRCRSLLRHLGLLDHVPLAAGAPEGGRRLTSALLAPSRPSPLPRLDLRRPLRAFRGPVDNPRRAARNVGGTAVGVLVPRELDRCGGRDQRRQTWAAPAHMVPRHRGAVLPRMAPRNGLLVGQASSARPGSSAHGHLGGPSRSLQSLRLAAQGNAIRLLPNRYTWNGTVCRLRLSAGPQGATRISLTLRS